MNRTVVATELVDVAEVLIGVRQRTSFIPGLATTIASARGRLEQAERVARIAEREMVDDPNEVDKRISIIFDVVSSAVRELQHAMKMMHEGRYE